MKERRAGIIVLCLAVIHLAGSFQNPAGTAPAAAAQSDGIVEVEELQGRVVCLAEEMFRLHQARLPTQHDHLWGFRTQDGTCYTLLRTKRSEALFTDERLREKELILKGRLFPKTQILEVMGNIRSVKSGVVHDLFYYCEICEIFSIAPGLCECCQAPTELVEKPL